MVIYMKQIIKWEIYKILIARLGIVFIFLYCILQVIFGIYNNSKLENKLSPITQNYIDSYYREYGGKLNENNCKNIEYKKTIIDNAVVKQQEALIKYENASITESDFNSIIENTFSSVKERNAFEIFYKNYNYCKDNIDKRFLINTSSWEVLLNVNSPDFAISFLLIALIAFSYIDDVNKKTLETIKNTKSGFSEIFWCKLIAFILLAIFIGLLEQLGKIIISINTAPIHNYSAPIQSLYFFSNSNYNISLLEAFIWGSVIKIWGLIYLSIITNTIILLIKNVMISTFSAAVILILPYFLLNKDNLYLSIPLPIGFLQQNIFFVNNNKPNKWIYASNGLLFLLITTFVISAILTIISYYYYKNRSYR